LIQPDGNTLENLSMIMLTIGINKHLDVSNGKHIQEIYVRSNDDEVFDREAAWR
jgi:hypothetical protein